MAREKPTSVVETPVHPPIILNESAYFFDPRHREFVNDPTAYLKIYRGTEPTIPIKVSGLFLIICWTLFTFTYFPHPILILVGYAFAFSVMAITYLIRFLQKRSRSTLFNLPSNAEIILGKVISCTVKSIPIGMGEYTYIVTTQYIFPVSKGYKLIGTDTRGKRIINLDDLPKQDTPVYVVYLSDTEHYLL